ncbi:hypothetical protein E0K83_02875 [Gramella sp. BOM4]|nr:hypothetical protein [Christiangramia bathymodioli]
MRKLLYLVLFLLFSCKAPEYKYRFNEEWSVLEVKMKDKSFREHFYRPDQNQNYCMPSIRFSTKDSTAVWPGFKEEINRFKFSVNNSITRISFSRIDSVKYEENDLYINLICQEFKIDKDSKLGRLTLSNKEGVKIRILPTERFIEQSKARNLD